MKDTYTTPDLEIIEFQTEDILTTSNELLTPPA